MDAIIQLLVAMAGLLLLSLGAMSMLAPARITKNFAIEPSGNAGLNTIRGVMGGTFLAPAVLLSVGLMTGETLWFLAVATITGVAAIGRMVSFAVDGFEPSMAPPLIVELTVVAILVTAHVQLGGAPV